MIKIIELNNGDIKIFNENCIYTMDRLIKNNEFIDCIATSPPYFNAREYSQWKTLEDYYSDMKKIFTKAYEVLNNHKYLILNVGDIVSELGGSKWNKKRIMLGARFVCMLEDIGFEIIDDFIWDKGEPQSKRHLGNPPYPYYQKPVNCYEHIIVAEKNILDKTKVNCPICNSNNVVSNSQTKINVQSWECKNKDCPKKSLSNRGKRFSARSIMMNNGICEDNIISKDLIKKWRRDIIKINPVIKINQNGENKVIHTAPFPKDIPEMAFKFFSCKNDVCCDIFLGSGTSGIVAVENNRKFVGVELCKEYYDLSVNNIKNALNNIE